MAYSRPGPGGNSSAGSGFANAEDVMTKPVPVLRIGFLDLDKALLILMSVYEHKDFLKSLSG